MQTEVQQLYQALSELEDTVSEKSRVLHDRISALETAYHANDWQTRAFKKEDETTEINGLKAALKDAEQRYIKLQEQFQQQQSHTAEVTARDEEASDAAVFALAQAVPPPPSPVVEEAISTAEKIEEVLPKEEPGLPKPVPAEKTVRPEFQFQLYLSLLVSLLAPLQALFSRISILHNVYDQIISIFQHYKKEGKTAVFLMTVSGILLLVMGFAYILQYSFVQLGVEWKLFSCFVISAGVVVLGIQLHGKRESMQDYAAALIGLGMILAYLCAYYMGTAFALVAPWVSFGLLTLLTLTAYILAHIYNTRIVALVSLVGGACLPMLGEGAAWLSLAYPGYLLLLNVSSLHLAHKIRWAPLAFIAFMLSAAMLQYQMSMSGAAGSTFNAVSLALIIHAFFYLYLTHSYQLLDTAAKAKATILMAANFALLITLLPQVIEASILVWFFCHQRSNFIRRIY